MSNSAFTPQAFQDFREASVSQSGLVGTGAQGFGGHKTFFGGFTSQRAATNTFLLESTTGECGMQIRSSGGSGAYLNFKDSTSANTFGFGHFDSVNVAQFFCNSTKTGEFGSNGSWLIGDISSASFAGNNIVGRKNGSYPGAGVVSQRLISQLTRASGQSLGNASTADIVSIVLTPGLWLLFGSVGVSGNSTDVTNVRGEISTVNGAQNNPPSGYSGSNGNDASSFQVSVDTGLMNLNNGDVVGAIPVITQNVTGNTTLYLTINVTFSGGAANAYGKLEAIRLP